VEAVAAVSSYSMSLYQYSNPVYSNSDAAVVEAQQVQVAALPATP
jgi:hypothetical protein